MLLLSMYPLGEARSGPVVRITRFAEALRHHVDVDVIEGSRASRRMRTLRYLLRGRLTDADAVYVESSNALPAETDILLMALAKLLGRPVATYFRDAYRLFPENYALNSIRRRLSRGVYPIAVWGLRKSSTLIAFPSGGLARAIGVQRPWLLPPGAPEPFEIPQRAGAKSLLYVGKFHPARHGGTTLLRAVELARARGADVDLISVTPEGAEPEPPWPAWLRIERATSPEIARLLPDVLATMVTFAPGPYNDLAVPIRLMEYLAYGRPIIATPRTETARIVAESGAGLVVDDGEEGLADGIRRLWDASDDERSTWSLAAESAARANSWDQRARDLLAMLGVRSGAI